ncbi:bifunctional serine/threonine-protein kinase/ABC transporter substrate-binding protein [Nostoc sp. CMAA1605]|uniref:bifunctional serine/threonine-protein kinase/ABC transporter substrate-binding protein n=1 Tax=Nostoc sp. CMAA1605 TaxID=2055159 RepID=UPI001F45B647|nr:bifunctional serine/threonine-protein kinase/ABC transporter substrate-binding protein [Nostoc sp. CMAA1605]
MPLILQGHFVAIELLGEGGFGWTFLGKDIYEEFADNTRVIKLLKLPHAQPQSTQNRIRIMFQNEAKILNQLIHERIPRYFASFTTEVEANTGFVERYYYLVQGYVEGQNLAQELADRECFSEDEVIDILREILNILRYVHNYDRPQGAIHRDIKPANIMRYSQNQRLYLIDFGAVKQIAQGLPVETTSIVLDKNFAPPEQFFGDQLSYASDLYALAATCLCLLTRNQNPNQLLKESDITDILKVQQVRNQHFATALELMLKHKVKDRPQSAQEVIDILDGRKQSQVVNFFNILKHYISDITSLIKSRVPIKLVTLALLSLVIVFVSHYLIIAIQQPIKVEPFAEPLRELIDSQQNEYAKYFTRGEESLIPELNNNAACQDIYQAKQDGMAAFKEASETGDQATFEKARRKFAESIQKSLANQNCVPDPETRIQEYNATVAQSNLARQGRLPTIVVANDVEKISFTNAEYKNKSIIGLEILRGVVQALDELDKNNPLFQILLVNYTLENSNPIAINIANQTIPGQGSYFNQSKILGVIGGYTSKYIKGVGDIYGGGKIVLIAPTSTAFREYWQRKNQQLSEYVFRTASNDYIASEDLANYIGKDHTKKQTLIVYNDNDEYSNSLQELLVSQLGKLSNNPRPIVCNLTANGNSLTAISDAEKRCIEIVDTAARGTGETIGVLILFPSSGYLKSAVEIANTVKTNHPEIQLIGGDVVYNKETLNVLQSSAEGMVIAVCSHASLANADFQNKASNFWKTRYVGWITMTSYDAAKVFSKAVETSNLKGLDQDGENIYKILTDRQNKFSVMGANTNVTFDRYGDREKITGVGVLVQVKRNSTRSDDHNFVLLEQPKRNNP